MASESSIRLWRVHKAAGRPWPVICPEDDVIDYMVMEAVAIKVRIADDKEAKEAERDAARQKFKKDSSALNEYR